VIYRLAETPDMALRINTMPACHKGFVASIACQCLKNNSGELACGKTPPHELRSNSFGMYQLLATAPGSLALLLR
jgi:hypothetical protein